MESPIVLTSSEGHARDQFWSGKIVGHPAVRTQQGRSCWRCCAVITFLLINPAVWVRLHCPVAVVGAEADDRETKHGQPAIQVSAKQQPKREVESAMKVSKCCSL